MKNPIPRRLLALMLALTCIGASAACSKPPAGQTENAGGAAAPSPASAADLEPVMTEKTQAVFERSCKNCHGPDGHGIAAVAPDLRRAPQRPVEEWVKYLRDPKSVHPNSQMPSLATMTDEDYEAVSAYLADLTQHNPPAGPLSGAKK